VTDAVIGSLGFLRKRIPELALVGAGLAFRISMLVRYDTRRGYDPGDHWPYIAWFKTHWDLPPLTLCRETYHPPLYYLIAGLFSRWQTDVRLLGFPSVVFGSTTLLLIWFGLEKYLPEQRLARLAALGLAAVLPASVHLTGMMTAEALNGLLSAVALLLAADMASRPTDRRFGASVLLGIVLGLEMLTKISALVTVAVVGAVAVIEALWTPGGVVARLRRAAPWAVVLVTLTLTSGWYFRRNERLYGKPFLSGFDGLDGLPAAEKDETPVLDRRTMGYFVGWSNDIYAFPFYPAALKPRSRFWPVLLGSTFVDYYNYTFAEPPREPRVVVLWRGLSHATIRYAKASVLGGTLIAATTTIAWFWSALSLWRRRDLPRLSFLMAPVLALAGQVYFTTRYNVDEQGPIKAIYMQFACAPLFAVFGLSVWWLARSRRTRVVSFAEVAALVAVAAYAVHSRFG
jgi:hypothetical protein